MNNFNPSAKGYYIRPLPAFNITSSANVKYAIEISNGTKIAAKIFRIIIPIFSLNGIRETKSH